MAGSLAACSGRADELRLAGAESGFGIALDDVASEQHMLIGAMHLCLSDEAAPDGAATLTAVRPDEADGGIRVDGFAVVELGPDGEAEGTGAYPGTLTADQRAAVTVSSECPADAEPQRADVLSELVIEVSKTTDGVASTDGLVVEYELGGKSGEYLIPLTLHLCPGKSSAAGCLG